MHDHPLEGTPGEGKRQRPETSPAARWGRIPAWWLDHPELDADGFAVLAALATYADEAGVCWPSQATLAAKLKRSRPTVNRILGRLEACGLVAIEHRSSSNGGRLSCRYRLRLTQDGGNQPAGPQAGQAVGNGGLAAEQTADSAMHSPCPAPSQEQLQSEQIPDSLPGLRKPGAQGLRGVEEVPADWRPGAADLSWAAERFTAGPAELDRHAELFVTRCRAHGYRYRDVAAAWRAWLLQDLPAAQRDAADRNRSHPPARPAPGRTEAAEQRLSAWAAVAARLQTAAPSAPASTWTYP